MRIIIAGGGTGGHLFPGIAVAEEFLKRNPASRVCFVGTRRGIEGRVIPREGYPIRFLNAEGLVGKSLLKKIRAVLLFGMSIIKSLRIISDEKPDIVLGVGGYASVGMVLAARLRGVRTMIMEQNSVPGLANRSLAKIVDAVAVTYQESFSSFPREKTYLTGNPVRRSIMAPEAGDCRALYKLSAEKFSILVFGGSQGARAINRALLDSLHYMLDIRQNIQFIHQTGEAELKGVSEAYRKLGFTATVLPFIQKMAEAYAAADMVICRAGATTLAELTAVGKASLLIPFPFAAANHQEMNARKLEDIGASVVITERQLNGQALAAAVRELYQNSERRLQMQRASRAVGKRDAAERIADLAERLIRK